MLLITKILIKKTKVKLLACLFFLLFCQSCSVKKNSVMFKEINVLFERRYDVYDLMLDDTIVILNQIIKNGILKKIEYPLKDYLQDSNVILKEFVNKNYNKDEFRIISDSGIFLYIKANTFSDSCNLDNSLYEITQEVNFKNEYKLVDTLFHFRMCDEYKEPSIRDSIFYLSGQKVYKVSFYKPIHKDSVFKTENEIINIEDPSKNPYQIVYYDSNGFIVKWLSNQEKIPLIPLPYNIVYKRYVIKYKE
jgi:hypothetical protein